MDRPLPQPIPFPAPAAVDAGTTAAKAYLQLLKQCLTYSLWGETVQPFDWSVLDPVHRAQYTLLAKFLARRNLRIDLVIPFDAEKRRVGRDWPILADTMIGHARLDNLQACIEDCLRNRVPGDLIETGIWRGGAAIFMRAVLHAYGDTERCVWAADSFEGCPVPDADKYPADAGDCWHTYDFLAVSRAEVEARFAKYGLLDDRVRFLEGWFKDTLPAAPIERLSVLRLDGDLYESTWDALVHLYPKLQPGGYCIVDDYALDGCKRAIDDYRRQHGIHDAIHQIDWTGVYWQRT
jgi:O-methyltransferase